MFEGLKKIGPYTALYMSPKSVNHRYQSYKEDEQSTPRKQPSSSQASPIKNFETELKKFEALEPLALSQSSESLVHLKEASTEKELDKLRQKVQSLLVDVSKNLDIEQSEDATKPQTEQANEPAKLQEHVQQIPNSETSTEPSSLSDYFQRDALELDTMIKHMGSSIRERLYRLDSLDEPITFEEPQTVSIAPQAITEKPLLIPREAPKRLQHSPITEWHPHPVAEQNISDQSLTTNMRPMPRSPVRPVKLNTTDNIELQSSYLLETKPKKLPPQKDKRKKKKHIIEIMDEYSKRVSEIEKEDIISKLLA